VLRNDGSIYPGRVALCRRTDGSAESGIFSHHIQGDDIMKDTEIINFYNNLDQYAKDKIDRQLIDLTNAKKESRNYCIKVCPKCGAVDLQISA
jgi:hypothetical protein